MELMVHDFFIYHFIPTLKTLSPINFIFSLFIGHILHISYSSRGWCPHGK